MKKRVLFVLVVIAVLLCTGCSSLAKMEKHYDSYLTEYDEIPQDCFLAQGEQPEIIHATDIYTDSFALVSKEYYIPIGCSYFNASEVNDIKTDIAEFCKKVGAKVAVYTEDFTGTDTEVNTVPTFYRSNYWGPGGWGPGFYSASVYAHTVAKYDYTIFFFVKMPEVDAKELSRFGLYCTDMDQSMKERTKRNTGAYTYLTFDKTPAFYANFVKGDIITAVNGQEITDSKELYDILEKIPSGEETRILFVRNGVQQEVVLKADN
ncbi:MAG: PDZ domain-containing protein [Sphaerochaetaceae bacterium]|nr:PDZ domain-containing protein [Sphaerochaetaceae bacterium]